MRRTALFIITFSLILVASVQAQQPQQPSRLTVTTTDSRSLVEVIAGLTFQAPRSVNASPTCVTLQLPCLGNDDSTSAAGGVLGSVAVFPGRHELGAVAEVGSYGDDWGVYGTNCPPTGGSVPQTCVVTQTHAVRSALGGVRLRSTLTPGVSASSLFFVQLLAGRQWSDVAPTQTVLQPGLGFQIYGFHNAVIFHLELSHRFAHSVPRDSSSSRFMFGIGIPLGS